MLKDFKAFLTRGNVVDLAVAVVIGGAFALLIKAFVDGIITPLIGAIFGKPNLDSLTFTIGKGIFLYGTVLTQLINFVLVAAAVYFVIVRPVIAIRARQAKGEEAPPAPTQEVLLLTEIRDSLQTR